MVFADESFNMHRVGRCDNKLPTSDAGRLLRCWNSLPIGIIRWRDVIDDDVRVVLTDEGVEIHSPVPNFMSESGERDDPGLFQRMTQKIDHVVLVFRTTAQRHCITKEFGRDCASENGEFGLNCDDEFGVATAARIENLMGGSFSR